MKSIYWRKRLKRLKRKIGLLSRRTVLIIIHMLLSLGLALLFSYLTTVCGDYGYLLITAISFLMIYLGQNSRFRHEQMISMDVQMQLIHICEILGIRDQYSRDIEKMILGPASPTLSMIAVIPYQALLFTAYAVIVLIEQMAKFDFFPEHISDFFEMTSGIKVVALSFLAVDRAISAFKKHVTEGNGIYSMLWGTDGGTVYQEPFGESWFYRLDQCMASEISGQIMLAFVDEHSMAYQQQIRNFDVIVSVNGETADQDGNMIGVDFLLEQLRIWREEKTALSITVVTAESDYKQSREILFDGEVRQNGRLSGN